MIEFLTNHVGEIANIMAILIPIFGLMTWSHRRLARELEKTNSRIDATGTRIDAMGNRIDHLYEIMMGMLKNQSGK